MRIDNWSSIFFWLRSTFPFLLYPNYRGSKIIWIIFVVTMSLWWHLGLCWQVPNPFLCYYLRIILWCGVILSCGFTCYSFKFIPHPSFQLKMSNLWPCPRFQLQLASCILRWVLFFPLMSYPYLPLYIYMLKTLITLSNP